MARTMFGPLVLMAASVTPTTPVSAPVTNGISNFHAVGRAAATATVSIRIVTGVRFGTDHPGTADGAERRQAQLTDASGALRPAELLEFQ
jgi:hypothetical protein